MFGKKVDIDERSPEAMVREAIAVSKTADVIVAVVGEASEMSGESASRTSIDLPENQKVLLRALKSTGKSLVVVLMAGRPLAIAEELELADALLWTWHPGVEAGNAIADVIFGDSNPSAKLTTTFPRNVGQIPIYYSIRNTGRPQGSDTFQKFKSNYLDAPNSPLLPFGYGLSYTQFEYKNLLANKEKLAGNEVLDISVDIANTGDYDGEEIVQLYVRDMVASVTRPIKELKGFQKVSIGKGESETVAFKLSADDLKFYDFDLEYDWEPGEFEIMVGPNSNDVQSKIVRWNKNE